MDFALFDRSALGRCCLGLLLMICPAFCLPVMSAGDALTLQLKQEDRLPQTVTSIKQLNTRVGDILSLSSEFGESFEFRVETSRRSNHGNKVIRGVSEAGGRLTMVVTSDGQLQGSLREDEIPIGWCRKAETSFGTSPIPIWLAPLTEAA